MTQHEHWSRAARNYEKDFVDPYRKDVRNPLRRVLARLAGRDKVVADLGCGIGPLLPFLAQRFSQVHAVDFAAGMLERARTAAPLPNITFHQRNFTDLRPLHGALDVAVAVNSLVLPDIAQIDRALREIHTCLKPGGRFLGIVPALDGVHYHLMLLVDRALAAGKPIDVARKNAAHFAEAADYDFAFGQFRYAGLEQHFWLPFEIRHRFSRAGFRLKRLKKVHLSWKQFACGQDLKEHSPPWDWFFLAER